jgi:hypothetical protein
MAGIDVEKPDRAAGRCERGVFLFQHQDPRAGTRRGPRRSGDVVTLVAHVAPGQEAEEPKLRAHAPTITMAR